MSDGAKTLSKEAFEKAISSEKPVFVDFFAVWCGPCQMMLPLIDELADEAKDYEVYKMDIDQAPEIAAKYGVMSVPTFIVFQNGEEKERMMGAMPKELLAQKIEAVIKQK